MTCCFAHTNVNEPLDVYEWGDQNYFIDNLIIQDDRDNWFAQITVDEDQLDQMTMWEFENGRKDMEDLPQSAIQHRWIAILSVPGPSGVISGLDSGRAQQVVSYQYQTDKVFVEEIDGNVHIVLEPYTN